MAVASTREKIPDGRSKRLWRCLLSLATPLEEQPSTGQRKVISMPGRSENLVVEFDEAYTVFVEGFEALPSESQMSAIQAVDAKLSSMVRAADETLWTDQARRHGDVWAEVRELAGRAIRAFEWPREA